MTITEGPVGTLLNSSQPLHRDSEPLFSPLLLMAYSFTFTTPSFIDTLLSLPTHPQLSPHTYPHLSLQTLISPYTPSPLPANPHLFIYTLTSPCKPSSLHIHPHLSLQTLISPYTPSPLPANPHLSIHTLISPSPFPTPQIRCMCTSA